MAITSSVLVDAVTDSTFGIRKYTERYLVTTDAPTTALRSIVDYSGVPDYGDGFSDDPISVVQNKSARQVDGTRTKFEVTVQYEPYERSGHNSGDDEFNNPLDAPPEYSWGFASREIALTHDINDNPIINTAGDQFIPATEITLYDLQLTIVQNVEDYRPEQSWLSIGTVNEKAFVVAGLEIPIKSALMTERTASSEVFEDESERIEYWKVTTVLVLRVESEWIAKRAGGVVGGVVQPMVALGPRNAWFRRILNAGLDEIKNGKPERISVDGQKASDPKLLKEDGTYEADSTGAVWVGAEVYFATDFGVFQL
jgi:hypothetical protein